MLLVYYLVLCDHVRIHMRTYYYFN